MMQIEIPTPTPPPPTLDPNYVFGEMMPLIAIVTIIVVGGLALRWLFRTPVGEAIAERIRHGFRRPGDMHEGGERTRLLEARVDSLHDQVGELAERLDFAERLLAERRERRVGPGE